MKVLFNPMVSSNQYTSKNRSTSPSDSQNVNFKANPQLTKTHVIKSNIKKLLTVITAAVSTIVAKVTGLKTEATPSTKEISSNNVDNATLSELFKTRGLELVSLILNEETEKTHRLLKKYGNNIDINVHGKYGWTPLVAAIERQDKETINKLLAREDVDINMKTEGGGCSPLQMAILRDDEKTTDKLLARDNINVNAQNDHGNTPLQMAIWYFDKEATDKLLARKDIDVNVQNIHGDTPLHMAIKAEYRKIIDKLLARDDFNFDIKNNDGKMAEDINPEYREKIMQAKQRQKACRMGETHQ